MTATLDFCAHQSLLHNVETITYSQSPGLSSVSITTALRTGTWRPEGAPSGGTYTQFKTGWQIASLSTDPKPGDTITDSNNFVYTVLSVQRPIFNSFWGIDSVRLNIETALDDVATWYRQTDTTTDIDADKIMNEIPYQVNVSCRVQPDASNLQDMLGKRGQLEKYLIYINTALEPQYGDYFVINSEVPQWKYRVVGWHNRRQIGELLVIETEIIP
jgi:hypothetical protein